MTEFAERPAHSGARRGLAHWTREFQRFQSPILRYGLSVVTVAIAVGVAFALQYCQFFDVELPVFTVAIALATWYGGVGPSVLAVLLSSACFDYFFTEPYYSFDMTSRDIAHFFVFDIWAAIVVSFFVVRRNRSRSSSSARQPSGRGEPAQAPRG